MGVSAHKNNLMKITHQNVSKVGTHLQKRKTKFIVGRPTTTCNSALIVVHKSLSHIVNPNELLTRVLNLKVVRI